jgi:hypothetical protein
VVLISQRLRAGQLRGVYQQLERRQQRLRQLQRQLANPRGLRRNRAQLVTQIDSLLQGQYLQGLITYRLVEHAPGRFALHYRTCRTALDRLEDHLGLRLLMTDRHDWSTPDIIRAYHSQAAVERAFRHLRNPHYLAVRPGFHWTQQKLRVHFFTCVLAYQLAALLRLTARQQVGFTGSPGRLLEMLSHIRLVTLLQPTGQAGRPQATHQLETRQPEEQALLEALGITDTHLHRPQITGVGVYTP